MCAPNSGEWSLHTPNAATMEEHVPYLSFGETSSKTIVAWLFNVYANKRPNKFHSSPQSAEDGFGFFGLEQMGFHGNVRMWVSLQVGRGQIVARTSPRISQKRW